MMPFIKNVAIAKATRRLDQAKAHWRACLSAQTPEEYAEAWGSFLIACAAVFNILETGSRHTPQGRQWYGGKRSEGKKDELILYMRQARNEEEHGIETTTGVRRSFKIHIPAGGTAIDVTKTKGQIPQALLDPSVYIGNKPTFTILPSRPALLPVRSREGDVFDPPTKHLGVAISSEPGVVAELYLQYVEGLIREAARHSD